MVLLLLMMLLWQRFCASGFPFPLLLDDPRYIKVVSNRVFLPLAFVKPEVGSGHHVAQPLIIHVTIIQARKGGGGGGEEGRRRLRGGGQGSGGGVEGGDGSRVRDHAGGVGKEGGRGGVRGGGEKGFGTKGGVVIAGGTDTSGASNAANAIAAAKDFRFAAGMLNFIVRGSDSAAGCLEAHMLPLMRLLQRVVDGVARARRQLLALRRQRKGEEVLEGEFELLLDERVEIEDAENAHRLSGL